MRASPGELGGSDVPDSRFIRLPMLADHGRDTVRATREGDDVDSVNVLIGVSAWCWVADVVQRATAALPRVIERFLEKAAVSLNLHLPSLPQLLPVHTQQQSVASVLTIRPPERRTRAGSDRGWEAHAARTANILTATVTPRCVSAGSVRLARVRGDPRTRESARAARAPRPSGIPSDCVAWGRETNERRVSTTYDPCMELPQQQILPHQHYAASDAAVSLRYQPRGSLYVLRSRNHQPAFPSMDVALTSQTRPNESRICRPIKLVLPLASDRTLARTLAPSAFVKLQALAR